MNVTSTGANKNRSADGIFKSCVVAGDSAVVSSVGKYDEIDFSFKWYFKYS